MKRIALLAIGVMAMTSTAARAQARATPSASAQRTEPAVVFDVGAGISHACLESCGGEATGLPSAFVSIWFGDRLQIQERFGQGRLPAFTFEVPRDGRFPVNAPDRVAVFIERRRLRFLTTSVAWLFRRGERVRPLLGVGLGTLTLPRQSRCEPVGCEPLLDRLAGPPRVRPHDDIVFTVGLNIRASERLAVRLGFSLHNPGGEAASAEELFAEVAWRLTRKR